jgi:CheY-like chemotaxis protein
MARYRILVVDDNKDSAVSMALLLKLQGHETRTAHDGLEAIEAAREHRPDVVLLDIGLPKINGYDACRTIRAQPWGERMVLIAMTGWGQEEDRSRSREAGFNFHLIKPVDPAELAKLLDGLGPTSA